jgi:hypothetical protein
MFKNRFLLSFLFLHCFVSAQEAISFDDRSQIVDKLNAFVSIVNQKVSSELPLVIAPDHLELIAQVRDKMNGLKSYALSYQTTGKSFEVLDGGTRVKVAGTYKEKATERKVSGFSTYFIFEKFGGEWFIVETDFAKPFSMGWMLYILIPLFLLMIFMFVFWIRMIIDCVKYQTESKTTWILILIFLNITGAIIYYLVVKRKRNTSIKN